MKLVKPLLLAAFLCLAPTVGLAGDAVFDDVPADDTVSPIPEPAGALLMGIGLLTVGLVWRRRR